MHSRYLGRSKNDPDYGLGKATINADKLGLIGEDELTQRLVATFEAPDYRPPRLPAVATELLALSQDPDVEFGKIESLLERDAMLAGEILSLARSASYSGRHQVKGLREALVRLGVKQLRQVVMQAALTVRVFRSKPYRVPMKLLQDHCRATAHLSRLISQHTSVAAEQAFMCGLLHDIGIAGILIILGDTQRGEQPPDLTVLWPAIHGSHTRAGARMVERWELPAKIVTAVGDHHHVSVDGSARHLAATVCLAEALALELDMGFVPPRIEGNDGASLVESTLLEYSRIDQTDPRTIDRARDTLGIAESTEASIRAAARDWARTDAACHGG